MKVRIYPDPVLRRGGDAVETFDEKLAETASEMIRTMYELKGVGLAAPQVGLPLALLVLNPSGTDEDTSEELVLVNPEIVRKKGSEFGEEGCLSFPRLYAEVERAEKVTVGYRDLAGEAHELRTDGFIGRIIQHELDHLNGVLFIDRLSSVEKLRVRAHLQEMERRFQESS
jgi:peptide deformylase